VAVKRAMETLHGGTKFQGIIVFRSPVIARTGCVVLFAVSVATLAAAACAAARNYDHPRGPVIEHQDELAAAGNTRAVTPDIRVVTFNIKFAEHVDEAVAILRDDAHARQADVLVLQEMDAPAADRLARALLMNTSTFPLPCTLHRIAISV